ncbi:winged helix-turn-helix transcriptional regulator [Trinickia sp.]|uniref:winged helix-turn-helix transcriptional regulator n=1 Tax=Trinickia sp. TaxID=2571163 RepID=UPI003F7FCE51
MKSNVSGCSVEEAMRLLGGRWRLLLVSYLLEGPKRFSELRRDVPGISQRMLTLDLRALEEAGLVKRTVFPEVPVKVEYRLTGDGQRLVPVVAAMKEFGLWLKARMRDTGTKECSQRLSDERPAGR